MLERIHGRPGHGLPAVITTLAPDDLIALLAGELCSQAPGMADEITAIIARDPDYEGVDTDQLHKSVQYNLEAVLRGLAGQERVDVVPPRDTVRAWAEQGIGLDSVLNAFRLGFAELWERMSELALREHPERLPELVRDSGRMWDLLESCCRLVASTYQDAVVEVALRDRERRVVLLDALFEGRLADWRRLGGDLRMLGLPGTGPYLAVSAENPAPGAECLPDVEEYLRRRGFGSAWLSRAHEQLGLIGLGHGAATVTEILKSLARGRVGLATPHEDALATVSALGAAAVACRGLPPGGSGVATIEHDPLAALIVHSPGLSRIVARLAFGAVMDIDAAERDLLLTTLRTWFRVGGRNAEAARLLYCHRNTVRNRLQRLERLSGRSLEEPRGIAELLIAAETIRLVPPDSGR